MDAATVEVAASVLRSRLNPAREPQNQFFTLSFVVPRLSVGQGLSTIAIAISKGQNKMADLNALTKALSRFHFQADPSRGNVLEAFIPYLPKIGRSALNALLVPPRVIWFGASGSQ